VAVQPPLTVLQSALELNVPSVLKVTV